MAKTKNAKIALLLIQILSIDQGMQAVCLLHFASVKIKEFILQNYIFIIFFLHSYVTQMFHHCPQFAEIIHLLTNLECFVLSPQILLALIFYTKIDTFIEALMKVLSIFILYAMMMTRKVWSGPIYFIQLSAIVESEQ